MAVRDAVVRPEEIGVPREAHHSRRSVYEKWVAQTVNTAWLYSCSNKLTSLLSRLLISYRLSQVDKPKLT
jgi:hypothetical protein